MRCFKVTLEYDGTDFAGFQFQPEQRSVQDEVEKAIGSLTGQSIRIHGAGRTDAGVHALGQVIGFQAETRIPIEKLPAAMNSALPRDIAAVSADEMEEAFHARFSAKSRTYIYAMLNRPERSAVFGRYAWHYPHTLDIGAMREAARRLVGTHDFRAWANEVSAARTTIRTVRYCRLRHKGQFVILGIRANAFLHGMVRNIVGTLAQVGGGKRPAEDIDRITESGDRAQCGPSAPAHGLCLIRVRY